MLASANRTTLVAAYRLDPRVKIILLAAVSVALFAVETGAGMALLAAVLLALCAAGRIPVGRFAKALAPVLPFAVLAVLFGAVSWQGGPALSAEGLAGGLLVGVRIMLLFAFSLVVSLTSTSTQQVAALAALMKPLRALHVPVDDAATTLSLALRFIPLMAQQLETVRQAQAARGACVYHGPLAARLKANAQCFVPLFVGMFRRADRMAAAMDARCYGLGESRGSLHTLRMAAGDWAALACGLAFCVSVGVFL